MKYFKFYRPFQEIVIFQTKLNKLIVRQLTLNKMELELNIFLYHKTQVYKLAMIINISKSVRIIKKVIFIFEYYKYVIQEDYCLSVFCTVPDD